MQAAQGVQAVQGVQGVKRVKAVKAEMVVLKLLFNFCQRMAADGGTDGTDRRVLVRE